MKKQILLIVLLFSFESLLIAQSEIHISGGIENSFVFPKYNYLNNSGKKPGTRFQLSFQHIFKHVGFMVAYENVKREIILNHSKTNQNVSLENGQNNSNRFMFYFLGRIKANSKLFFDLRVGLGKLIETNKKYYTNSLFSTVFMNIIPGLSMSWGVRPMFKFSNYVAVFMDASYTLTPFSYSSYNDGFWGPVKQTRSGYLSNLSLSIGIAFSFKK
jgi:hypothetical protein